MPLLSWAAIEVGPRTRCKRCVMLTVRTKNGVSALWSWGLAKGAIARDRIVLDPRLRDDDYQLFHVSRSSYMDTGAKPWRISRSGVTEVEMHLFRFHFQFVQANALTHRHVTQSQCSNLTAALYLLILNRLCLSFALTKFPPTTCYR